MARKPLKPQLNQIRAWVRQGRTDAWIAHQLEISATELREFRRQHDLSAEDEQEADVDLRDEIEAEIEAAQAREPVEDDDGYADEEAEIAEDEDEDDTEEADGAEAEGRPRPSAGGTQAPRKRRRRRGGRGRSRKAAEFEATFDHGDKDGYGLWLDPAVVDDPAYKEHWAGHRAVTVTVERERLVIRRSI